MKPCHQSARNHVCYRSSCSCSPIVTGANMNFVSTCTCAAAAAYAYACALCTGPCSALFRCRNSQCCEAQHSFTLDLLLGVSEQCWWSAPCHRVTAAWDRLPGWYRYLRAVDMMIVVTGLTLYVRKPYVIIAKFRNSLNICDPDVCGGPYPPRMSSPEPSLESEPKSSFLETV